MKPIFRTIHVIVAITCVLLARAPAAQTFDLAGDYSRTSNPNGVWSFGWEGTIGGAFSLLTTSGSVPFDNGVPVDYWRYSPPGEPALFHNGTTNTAISNGGAGVHPPGVLFCFPGVSGSGRDFGVMRFTAPADGEYQVETAAGPFANGSPQGDTDFHVVRNGTELFGTNLPAGGSAAFGATLTMSVGETIDLAVGRGADNNEYGSALNITARITTTATNAVPTNGPPVDTNGLPAVTNCAAPANGLTLWLPLDGDAQDAIGGGQAVLIGSPAFVGAKVGQGLRFDGADDAVRVPASPAVDIGSGAGMTIEMWINPGQVGSPAAVLEWSAPSGSQLGIHFYTGQYTAGSLFLNVVDFSGTSHPFASPPGVISQGVLQHVAVTYDRASGVGRFFVNGAQVAQSTLGDIRPETRVDLWLGQRVLGSSHYRFSGVLDEVSLYNRALSQAEVQAIALAGAGGKCKTPVAPQIVTQPASRTVVAGESVSFTVSASGTSPLSYQWQFNDNPIADATNSTLTLQNVQLNQSGNYSVTVENSLDKAVSSNAVLVVNRPPATVRVVSANAAAGAEVGVPVELVANGNENAMGFSLSFNSSLLSFSAATVGVGAPAGTTLFLNTNDAAAGRLGLVVGLPADQAFAEGTQQVALITFLVAPVLNQVNATVSVGDQPTLRQLSDVHAQVLPASFLNGIVSIADSQFEADVAPRPDGSRSVATIDWVQMGRFVARLDTISGSNEFQRADCAPRETKGNGLLTASDWVQAGRYAVGLDPLTILGGPTEPATDGGGGGFAPASLGRQLYLVNTSIAQGQTSVVPVTLECQGNENTATFSIGFDPAKLKFLGGTPGSAAGGALLNINTNEALAGRVGVALALQPGTALPAGTREILRLQFSALATPPATVALAFTNAPVPREISDSLARPLITDYAAGTVTVTPPPGPPLKITHFGGSLYLVSWPSSATGFQLEATLGALGTAWTPVSGVGDVGDQKAVIVTLNGTERYFRLRKP